MAIRTDKIRPAGGELKGKAAGAGSKPKVVVSGAFEATTDVDTNGTPVFAVWANDQKNIVAQIVLHNQKKGSVDVDLTDLLVYDQGFAVFGIEGVVMDWPGLTSSKIDVSVKAANTTEEKWTWKSKAPFLFRTFEEAYTINS